MPIITKIAESLDWPDDEEAGKVTVECAGRGFMEFYEMLKATGENEDKIWDEELEKDSICQSKSEDTSSEGGTEDDATPPVDLFSLSETELEEIDYYKVLHLPCRPTISPDDVKKAYRKSCLKYHPDKSGRGEEDAVFLKVKTAFETLSTQKKAYDSTEMPFNESIPSDKEVAKKDFFQLWEPVFKRNLHFDSRLLPSSKGNGGNKRNNRRSSGSSRNLRNKNNKMPSLGDADTPVDEVHEYYDYWIHFESWRDFSLQAARELETQEHLDNAESRYEKRWFQKEIDRAAKKLKQQEVARITLLVEKAMASDPRLIQEKRRLIEEKENKQRQRKQDVLDKKQAEEDTELAEQLKAEEERRRKAEEKVVREQEKKKVRKAKQAFKKYVGAALEELEQKEYALEDEVDLICAELNRLKLTKLNSQLEGKPASDVVAIVKKRSENVKNGVHEEGDDEEVETGVCEGKGSCAPTTNEEETVAPPPSTSSASTKKKALPFSKEELTALAKGAKKFPPGGANRWDQISTYINNVCRPQDPRTREECIEIFNKINKSAKSYQNGNKTQAPVTAPTTSTSDDNLSDWTPEQDVELQNGLSTYPASIEKNERWSSIADGVTGKSKKECVNRFKEIRNSLKAKK
jgi:DnaJ family protein C protein 2